MADDPTPTRHIRVFIGSSIENLEYAEAIASSLEYDAECEIWTDAFGPSGNTLDSLIKKLIWSDFGVFIFGMEDKLEIRDQTFSSTRDNVLFELGMFIGGLGQYRSIAVVDRSAVNARTISDLSGFTTLDFDSTKSNATNATRTASTKIKQVLRRYQGKPIFGSDKKVDYQHLVPADLKIAEEEE